MCQSNEKQKRHLCIAYLILSFVVSFVAFYFADDEAVGFGILTAVVAGTWCSLDADGRGVSLSRPMFWGILLISFVFVAVYLIKTRRRRALMSIARAGLLFVAAIIIATLGSLLAETLQHPELTSIFIE